MRIVGNERFHLATKERVGPGDALPNRADGYKQAKEYALATLKKTHPLFFSVTLNRAYNLAVLAYRTTTSSRTMRDGAQSTIPRAGRQ